MNDQTRANQRNLTSISGMARHALIYLLISRVLIGQTTNTSSSFVTLCPSVYYLDTIIISDRLETEDNSHGISQLVRWTSRQGYRRIHYRIVLMYQFGLCNRYVILIVRKSRLRKENKSRVRDKKCLEMTFIFMLNLFMIFIKLVIKL